MPTKRFSFIITKAAHGRLKINLKATTRMNLLVSIDSYGGSLYVIYERAGSICYKTWDYSSLPPSWSARTDLAAIGTATDNVWACSSDIAADYICIQWQETDTAPYNIVFDKILTSAGVTTVYDDWPVMMDIEKTAHIDWSIIMDILPEFVWTNFPIIADIVKEEIQHRDQELIMEVYRAEYTKHLDRNIIMSIEGYSLTHWPIIADIIKAGHFDINIILDVLATAVFNRNIVMNIEQRLFKNCLVKMNIEKMLFKDFSLLADIAGNAYLLRDVMMDIYTTLGFRNFSTVLDIQRFAEPAIVGADGIFPHVTQVQLFFGRYVSEIDVPDRSKNFREDMGDMGVRGEVKGFVNNETQRAAIENLGTLDSFHFRDGTGIAFQAKADDIDFSEEIVYPQRFTVRLVSVDDDIVINPPAYSATPPSNAPAFNDIELPSVLNLRRTSTRNFAEKIEPKGSTSRMDTGGRGKTYRVMGDIKFQTEEPTIHLNLISQKGIEATLQLGGTRGNITTLCTEFEFTRKADNPHVWEYSMTFLEMDNPAPPWL